VPFFRQLSDPELPQHPPRDTIASGGSVFFHWHGYDDDYHSSISGYRYKLTETDFVKTDSTVTSVDYGLPTSPTPGALPIGLNTFRVLAVDEAGGSTQPDSTRLFIVNFSPDTWLAGADPSALASHLLTDSLGTYFPTDSTTTSTFGRPFAFPGNPYTDTTSLLPSERPVTDGLQGRPKTILEERTTLDKKVRNFIRSENDTVAFGSLIVARFGGTDKDSPYKLPGGGSPDSGRVYQAGPANGSPIGFQARIQYALANGGGIDNPFSTEFPNIDPTDALFNNSVLFTVSQIDQTGRAYLQFRAVDGDHANDGRIGDGRAVESSLSPALRSKLFTFYSNFNPGLLVISPARNAVIDSAGSTNQFPVVLRVTDPDPDPAIPGNGTYRSMQFSIRIRVYAQADSSQLGPEQGWQDPLRGQFPPEQSSFFPYTAPLTLNVIVPSDVPNGLTTLEIEVSDNPDRLKARIIHVKIPFSWRHS
jgi:hypothetical protein